MTREEQKGWCCRLCGKVNNMHRLDCDCMVRLTLESDCAKHRAANWDPLYRKVTVTMGTANRG